MKPRIVKTLEFIEEITTYSIDGEPEPTSVYWYKGSTLHVKRLAGMGQHKTNHEDHPFYMGIFPDEKIIPFVGCSKNEALFGAIEHAKRENKRRAL